LVSSHEVFEHLLQTVSNYSGAIECVKADSSLRCNISVQRGNVEKEAY